MIPTLLHRRGDLTSIICWVRDQEASSMVILTVWGVAAVVGRPVVGMMESLVTCTGCTVAW